MSRLSVLFLLLCSFSICAVEKSDKERLRKILKPFFVTVKANPGYQKENAAKVLLGKTLFFDKSISKGENISCNSCHDLQKYGSGGEHYLQLKEEGKAFRDVPSIYNINSLELFNWDGSQKDLVGQIEQSLHSEHEMAIEKSEFLSRLKAKKGYEKLFHNAYSSEVNYENAVDALTVFVNGLVTPSPVDLFIDGDDSQLTDEQIEGGLIFDSKNCYTCHTGSNFGGQMMQKMGAVEPWPNQDDLGYFHVTKNPSHKMIFRVSPLRNIEKTPPYFHDGSSKRVWDAVKKMGRYEMGIYISVSDILKIQTFLKSFTGTLPQEYIKGPSVPE